MGFPALSQRALQGGDAQRGASAAGLQMPKESHSRRKQSYFSIEKDLWSCSWVCWAQNKSGYGCLHGVLHQQVLTSPQHLFAVEMLPLGRGMPSDCWLLCSMCLLRALLAETQPRAALGECLIAAFHSQCRAELMARGSTEVGKCFNKIHPGLRLSTYKYTHSVCSLFSTGCWLEAGGNHLFP